MVRDSIGKLQEQQLALEQGILALQAGSLDRDTGERTSLSDEHVAEVAAPAEKSGPRIVASPEKRRAAGQLASTLIDALADYFVSAEEQSRSEARNIRTSLWRDLEKQRGNIETLLGRLAEQLGQQEEALSSLLGMLDQVGDRLNRQADALRSLSESQLQQAAAVRVLLEALRGLGAPEEVVLPQQYGHL